MLAAAERWGGGEEERPFLPRAFSVLRARGGGAADAGAAADVGAAADMGEAASAGAAASAGTAARAGGVRLEFMLEAVGPGTERLCELGPGDGLHVTGPLGLGFTGPGEERRALLCGGGVGTAPLAIWQDELLARGEPAPALLGFRDAEHAPGAALLHNARIATDDGSHGHHGLVTDLLTAELDADPHAVVYACGPPPMLEAVRGLCAARGVPCQLALESGMACGFGACFGCVVPLRAGGYLRLCVDGPVLDGALLEEVPAH
jgi:dihydroorotate dehydrogenase electron transfer subunit